MDRSSTPRIDFGPSEAVTEAPRIARFERAPRWWWRRRDLLGRDSRRRRRGCDGRDWGRCRSRAGRRQRVTSADRPDQRWTQRGGRQPPDVVVSALWPQDEQGLKTSDETSSASVRRLPSRCFPTCRGTSDLSPDAHRDRAIANNAKASRRAVPTLPAERDETNSEPVSRGRTRNLLACRTHRTCRRPSPRLRSIAEPRTRQPSGPPWPRRITAFARPQPIVCTSTFAKLGPSPPGPQFSHEDPGARSLMLSVP